MNSNVIYQIVNMTTKYKYIGRTKYPEKRKKTHFNMLEKNIHHSIHLQRAYNKYGKEVFKFEILEIKLSDIQAIEREQYYLDNEKNLYNVNNNAKYGGDLISYHPNRELIRKK